MAKHNTLVSDIYRFMQTKEPAEGVDFDSEIDKICDDMKAVLKEQLTPDSRRDIRGLRMSQIGKPDRQVMLDVQYEGEQRTFPGPTLVKFLYGHLIEAMLIGLVRLTGHEVTDEQKVCRVAGIKGHMDCRIDGILTDVKSCSTYGFKKFRDRSIVHDDPFGYVGQIKGYAHAEGDSEFGWLAMDKQNGHLTFQTWDMDDKSDPDYPHIQWDVEERIEHLKKLVALESGELPPVCHEPVKDGTSGNMKLAAGCSYCPHREKCWPDVRTFIYSTGPKYLTKVVRTPRVTEIEKGF